MEIIVIGTEPPCVRCLTTYNRAREVARNYPAKIEVSKVAIHSAEAEKYGKAESGGGIAKAVNMTPDTERMGR